MVCGGISRALGEAVRSEIVFERIGFEELWLRDTSGVRKRGYAYPR
jgi:hypothetical protein